MVVVGIAGADQKVELYENAIRGLLMNVRREDRSYDRVKVLLCKLREIDATINFRPSSLSTAIRRGDQAMVRLLLDHGADHASWKHRWNRTPSPLHAAARSGLDETICQRLLDACAELDVRDRKGYTPLHVAVGSSDCVLASFF